MAAPVITSSAQATGNKNQPLSYQITATNNPVSYASSGLPAGLTVNLTTGLISGTPANNGVTTITVVASNSSGAGIKNVDFIISPYAYTTNILDTQLSAVNTVISQALTAINKYENAVNEIYPIMDWLCKQVVYTAHKALTAAVIAAGGPFTGAPNNFGQAGGVAYNFLNSTFTSTVSTITASFNWPTNSKGQNLFPAFSNIYDYTSMQGTTYNTGSKYLPYNWPNGTTDYSTNYYRHIGGNITDPDVPPGPIGRGSGDGVTQTQSFPFTINFGIARTGSYNGTVNITSLINSYSATVFNDLVYFTSKIPQDCFPYFPGLYGLVYNAYQDYNLGVKRRVQVYRMLDVTDS